MRRHKNSRLDDVKMPKVRPPDGYPILFPNQQVRRMVKLVRAGEDDILFDLGCGWAQNLIVAAEDFRVGQCVGIEKNKARYETACKMVESHSLKSKVRILPGRYQDLFRSKFPRRASGIRFVRIEGRGNLGCY
jgi:tRNA G46 methylase TrmB